MVTWTSLSCQTRSRRLSSGLHVSTPLRGKTIRQGFPCDTKLGKVQCWIYALKKAPENLLDYRSSVPSLKATVENPRGSVEKLSPKESVKGADTVLRGSVRAPEGFSEGKPEAAKPRGRSPQGFAAEFALGKSLGSPHTAP